MLTTIRAFAEFFSTDVVIAGGKDLESKLPMIHDIDTLIKKHHLHVNSLMKGTLLTNEFLDHQNAIAMLVEAVNRYAALEDAIEGIIDQMLDRIDDSENFAEDGDVLIHRFREELQDSAYQVSQILREFDDRLDAVYSLASRKDAPAELQRLEVRLSFCVVRAAPAPAPRVRASRS
jgi:hypothetical protein